MEHSFLRAMLLYGGVAGVVQTFAAAPDSLSMGQLNEVSVMAVKAPANAPFAVTKVSGQELQEFGRTGKELPFLFARTPGVIAWSENGLGTGTTYMRMRGASASRINVTLDGVALNSPEDQCVFWANMNSYAKFLGGVQIQRGVGSSTNGDGAFGGSIALQTTFPSLVPSLELTGSFGSYNTWNSGLNFSSGLMGGHWVLDGAYHHTGTDGYIHGTAGNSGSYYAGLTYFSTDGRLKLSYKSIGNYEKTGQAWNGVTAGNDDYSLNSYGGVHSYKDLYDMGLGRFNSLYEHIDFADDGSWTVNRHRMADGSLWERTTDNFYQNHNLLNLSWQISDCWSTSGTLHYTHGHGYYDEFRYNNKLSKFGLSQTPVPGVNFPKCTDFVRQKGLTQDTYGMLWNVRYAANGWNVLGGASFQMFEGDHYGLLTYIADQAVREYYMPKGRYDYYDSKAQKSDAQLFAKATYDLTSKLSAFADLQYRHVSFMTSGINDRFYDNGDGTYSNQRLDIAHSYDFLNPKAGLSFHHNGHNAYVSYALGHREPERNNFTDNGSYPAPKAESVHDVELGYSYENRIWHAGLGLYSMLYHNQFVQTGMQSDIGENLTTNVRRSYRMGLELSAGVNVTRWFSLEANAALSRNCITDFDEVIEDWDSEYATFHYDHSTLAFSPSAILNGFADFHVGGFSATWHTNFVSRQYLDNSENKDRSLPKYSQTDIHLSYDLKCGRKGLKHTIFGVDFNNIFDAHYASSGWVYSAVCGSGGYDNNNRYYQIGYIPMAGFTVMGNITLKF